MKLFSFDSAEAAKILRDGGLVAFPTETVFGIGCRFDNKASFDRLIKVKRRPATKPFTMMLWSKDEIDKYAYATPRQQKIIAAFLPGEITVILKKKDTVPGYVTLNGPTLGIRVPAHAKLQALLAKTGIPLLVPSANRSGEKPCSSAGEIQKVFGDDLDGVIDDKAGGGVPSTVVLLTGDEPKILRQGNVSAEAINKVWNS